MMILHGEIHVIVLAGLLPHTNLIRLAKYNQQHISQMSRHRLPQGR